MCHHWRDRMITGASAALECARVLPPWPSLIQSGRVFPWWESRSVRNQAAPSRTIATLPCVTLSFAACRALNCQPARARRDAIRSSLFSLLSAREKAKPSKPDIAGELQLPSPPISRTESGVQEGNQIQSGSGRRHVSASLPRDAPRGVNLGLALCN